MDSPVLLKMRGVVSLPEPAEKLMAEGERMVLS